MKILNLIKMLFFKKSAIVNKDDEYAEAKLTLSKDSFGKEKIKEQLRAIEELNLIKIPKAVKAEARAVFMKMTEVQMTRVLHDVKFGSKKLEDVIEKYKDGYHL